MPENTAGLSSQATLFELPEPEKPPVLFDLPDAQPMRRCHGCGVNRPITMFYVATEERASFRRGYRVRNECRLCQRQRNIASMKPRRDYVDAIKLANGCTDCGLKIPHPEIYDFDHLPQFAKTANVAELLRKGTMDDLMAEIAKCEVVCANCHRIRTSSRPAHKFGRDSGAGPLRTLNPVRPQDRRSRQQTTAAG
jgi:hypothetical protein